MAEPSLLKKNLATAGIALLMILSLFATVGGFIGGIGMVDFAMTDARNGQACVTAWDAKFEPRYDGSQCSIMQRGYRVPAPKADSYGYGANSVSSPEGRDW